MDWRDRIAALYVVVALFICLFCFLPYGHLFNEYYPRDISRKVRQVKRQRAEQGKFIGSHAPYGYVKSPDDKHLLIVDKNAAPVVKRIFSEYANGDSARMIADGLTNDGYEPPAIYLKRTSAFPGPESRSLTWGAATVLQMLRNHAYVGDLAQGKRRSVSFKSKKRCCVDPDDWIIVQGTHEPIVDREVWDEVQERLKDRARTRRKKDATLSLFSGLLECADCGAKLAYTAKNTSKGRRAYYRCSRYNNNGKQACSTHRVSEDFLKQVVMLDIAQYAILAQEERAALVESMLAMKRSSQSGTSNLLISKQRELENRLAKIATATKKLYEDRCDGTIPDTVFKELLDSYLHEKMAISAKVAGLTAELKAARSCEEDVQQWVSIVEACLDLVELDRVTVTELVEKIVVGETVVVDGKPQRTIDIHYKFVGRLTAQNEKDTA